MGRPVFDIFPMAFIAWTHKMSWRAGDRGGTVPGQQAVIKLTLLDHTPGAAGYFDLCVVCAASGMGEC